MKYEIFFCHSFNNQIRIIATDIHHRDTAITMVNAMNSTIESGNAYPAGKFKYRVQIRKKAA